VTVKEFAEAVRGGVASPVLDVRSPAEWEDAHLAGSHHRYVPDLPDLNGGESIGLTKDEAVWVACASGYRATIAAGLLERAGFQPIVLARGGMPDVLRLLATQSAA
jgi:rhodanese-related sulfurtransferase